MKTKLFNPNFTHVCEIIEFIRILEKQNKKCSLKDIQNYFGKTPSYTKTAINFIISFGIIKNTGPWFTLNKDISKEIDGNRIKSILIVKNIILKFKPYLEYYYFLNSGKNSVESAKLTKKIYEIDRKEDQIIRTFELWTEYFNIKPNSKVIKPKQNLIALDKILTNEFLIRNFIREQLKNNYRYVSSNVIEDILKAFKNYYLDPPKAINDIGRALEDFLRLDFAEAINLTACSGITQIANELNKYSISHKKHNNILVGLGSIRSMGDAHGVDRNSKEKWKINNNSALMYILFTVSIINSLLEFKNNKALIF